MRRGLNRNAVLDAAISIGDREGFSAITVGTLAAALKIKPPSLYKHVSGVDDIIDGVGIRGANMLVTELSGVRESKNPKRAFIRACESYRTFAMRNPTCYAALQPALRERFWLTATVHPAPTSTVSCRGELCRFSDRICRYRSCRQKITLTA